MLVPIGECAYRTNLLSALLSAAAAGLFFLVVHESLRGVVEGLSDDAARRLLPGWARPRPPSLGAFTFTNWQNSNETEVYAVATFTIAAMLGGACSGGAARGTERAPRFLLLIVYLAGISIGNHLLALLAGPASLRLPGGDAAARAGAAIRRAAARVGPGGGGRRRLGAAGRHRPRQHVAHRGRRRLLPRRRRSSPRPAGQGPSPSRPWPSPPSASRPTSSSTSARPSIRSSTRPRPRRSMRCSPSSGARSIRRARRSTTRRCRTARTTPAARSRSSSAGSSPTTSSTSTGSGPARLSEVVRKPVTILFLTLGLRGLLEQRRSDRAAWWLLLGIFLVTGLGLVGYMNFRPGSAWRSTQWPEPGRPRGARAGLLLRRQLHRLGTVGRDRRHRVRRGPGSEGLGTPSWRPALLRRGARAGRAQLEQGLPAPRPRRPARRRLRLRPAQQRAAVRRSSSPTATTTPSRSGGLRRWKGSGRT